jgi:hypothetical protein
VAEKETSNTNAQFSQLYQGVGAPGAVFDTRYDDPLGLVEQVTRATQVPDGFSFDRSDPDITSFKMLLNGSAKLAAPDQELQTTLTVVSSVKAPFQVDLGSDLQMYLNNTLTAFSYVKPWANNRAVIKFRTPKQAGTYQIWFHTDRSVNVTTATAQFTVEGSAAGGVLLNATKLNKGQDDVSLLKVTAQDATSGNPIPTFAANPSLTQARLQNVSSGITAGMQVFEQALPDLPGGDSGLIKPCWASLYLKAFHPDFSTLDYIELAVQDLKHTDLWTTPVVLPKTVTPGQPLELNWPFPDWNDLYLLFQSWWLDQGWQAGFIQLRFTHGTGSTQPVSVLDWTVTMADPAQQTDVQITDQNGAVLQSILPMVWQAGTAYAAVWSETN